jgi:ABC-type uncharacterized transport system substrate-binding protein
VKLLAVALGLLGAAPARGTEVALVKSADTPSWAAAIEAFKRGLSGQRVIEYDLRGEAAEAQRVATELKERAVIVVALGTLAAQTVHAVAPERPLIYGMVPDPGQAGLLGATGAVGVSITTPVRNQLAAFRMVNPRGVRVGVVHGEGVRKLVDEAVQASQVVRLMIVARRVASEREIPPALRALFKGSDAVDALWLPPDPLLVGDEMRRFVLAEATKAGRPVYTFAPAIVAEGALVSNGPDPVSMGEQLAELVARVAGGAGGARADLLVPRAELVINRTAAQRLKLEIPATAISAASKVY